MRLTDYFVPDLVLSSFEELDVPLLRKLGMKHVIADVDNTLSPYEEPDPPEKVVRWAGELKKNGVSLSLVSNNGKKRIERYAAPLGVFTLPGAKKPGKKAVLLAMKEAGSDRSNTCVLGDQIFTDVWSGKRCRLLTVFVPPIRDRKDVIQRLKRALEKPILKKARKRKEKEG